MTRWEYRTVQGNPLLSDDQLNKIAREGWELFSTTGRGDHKSLVYIFRRQVTS